MDRGDDDRRSGALALNEVAGVVGVVTVLSAAVATGWVYQLSAWYDVGNVPLVASVPGACIGVIGGLAIAALAWRHRVDF